MASFKIDKIDKILSYLISYLSSVKLFLAPTSTIMPHLIMSSSSSTGTDEHVHLVFRGDCARLRSNRQDCDQDRAQRRSCREAAAIRRRRGAKHPPAVSSTPLPQGELCRGVS